MYVCVYLILVFGLIDMIGGGVRHEFDLIDDGGTSS